MDNEIIDQTSVASEKILTANGNDNMATVSSNNTQQIVTLHAFSDLSSNVIKAYTDKKELGVRVMGYGDWILVAITFENIKPLLLKEGEVWQTNMGHFDHADFVGKPFGTKVYSKKDAGFVYVLPFNPKLWTGTLARRTQIIFIPDISIILARANLLPGQIVLEAGTGSASLTHHLASAVYPSGYVHTFDIVPDRTESARLELEQHGLGKVVSCYTRNVCEIGYPDGITSNTVDFVFLDMPEPNKAIPFAIDKMKLGGTLCVFVPCVEQAHKAISAAIDAKVFGCIESVRGHAVSYDFEMPHVPLPPCLNTGIKDKRRLEDPISAPTLKPMKHMRTHTSYLIFMKKIK